MMARSHIRPGFWLVFWREVGWLRRRPFLLGLTTIVPLAQMAFLAAIFSAGLATRLPIGVLDLDSSDLSRTIIRMVDATPDFAVAVRVGDLAEGRGMILSGKIHGLLMLPLNLQRDVFAGRRPEVVFFYNTQTLTTGNLTARGVNAAIPTAAAGIRLSLRTAQGQPLEVAQADLQPIPVQIHALFNPTLNYVYFLLTALIPSILQVIMVTATAYSVGLDVETRHRLRILGELGGGIWPAMAGKILPYTILFMLVLGLSDTLLFVGFGLPLHGRSWLLIFAGLLFVLSCQFLGALLALVLKPIASAVSIGTLLTAPAFGFMGIGFPRLGMNAFAYGYGALLPGTWYLTARIDQTVQRHATRPLLEAGAGPARFHRRARGTCRVEAGEHPIRSSEPQRGCAAARRGVAMSGLLDVFRHEFRRIFTVKSAFAVMVLGAAFYALFYPQPYLNEALRDVPIALVDRDGTQSSRDLARRVDATPDVAITAELPDVASAEREVYARRVGGILVIPQYFERELLHGRPSPVALYADASYFLIYQRVAGAVAGVARTVGAEIETARLIAIGVDPAIAAVAPDPMPLTAVPLFNPEGGYATYVLPAAFVLILQQTLLMGVGLLSTLPGADPGEGDRGRRRPLPAAIVAESCWPISRWRQ